MWTDPHQKRQEMKTLEINKAQGMGPYILILSLHVGGVVQEEFGVTRGIMQWHNSLVMRHIKVIRIFLQGLLNIETKYAKTVSDNVVAPMLQTHIVQILFLQKQTIAQEWQCLCFLQSEVTHLQKWIVGVFQELKDLQMDDGD